MEQFEGGVWRTTDFKGGDILMFNMYCAHMSTKNMSENKELRISCDTRWLPENHKPDPRYIEIKETKCVIGHGNDKFGLYAKDDIKTENNNNKLNTHIVTINQLRQKWGI